MISHSNTVTKRKNTMNTNEIKAAVDQGKTVHWSNSNYVVIKDDRGEYLIKSICNNHYIGLTWCDDMTLNGKESEFFIAT